MMSLEVKVSQLESDNITKDLRVKDLELSIQELQLQLKNITVKLNF